jgi:drug/metabolite transporter (DMT)-like permease
MHFSSDDTFSHRSQLLMLGSVILFAANTLLIRAIALHMPIADGWIAMLFRGVVGLLFVFAVYGFGRGLDAKRLLKGKLITIRGLIGALSTVAFYITIIKLGAGRAVIINLSYPIFASVIAALWLKEKISRRSFVWMLIGFCGLMVFISDEGQMLKPSLYDWVALAGALGSGWVVVIIRRLRHEEHPATIYASQALYGTLIAAPVVTKIPALPTVACAGLILGAMIVTVAQLIMTKAYQSMSVSRGSSLQMLLPLITAAGGFLFFGETFHPVELAGAALALFATWRVVAGN